MGSLVKEIEDRDRQTDGQSSKGIEDRDRQTYRQSSKGNRRQGQTNRWAV